MGYCDAHLCLLTFYFSLYISMRGKAYTGKTAHRPSTNHPVDFVDKSVFRLKVSAFLITFLTISAPNYTIFASSDSVNAGLHFTDRAG